MADCPYCAAAEHADRQRARFESMPGYEVCPSCNGATVEDSLRGPVSCSSCRGQGWLPSRDDRGRFAGAEVTP